MNRTAVSWVGSIALALLATGCAKTTSSSGGSAITSTGSLSGVIVSDEPSFSTASSALIAQAASPKPVSAAVVRVEGTDKETKTKDDGSFKLDDVPVGARTVVAEKVRDDGKDFKSHTTVVVRVGKTVDVGSLDIEQAGAVYGVAKLADKATGQYLGIAVMLPETQAAALTDEGGAYAFVGVEGGSYSVAVSMPGYQDAQVTGITVTPGLATEVADITLQPDLKFFVTHGLVAGKVVDQATSAGLTGVLVALKGTSLATRTGAQGTFSLGLPPGSYTLVGSVEGYGVGQVNTTVAKGATVSVTMKLSKATTYADGEIVGTVVDIGGTPVVSAVVVSNPAVGQGISDNTGVFSLVVPPGCYTLTVAKGGYDQTEFFRCVEGGQQVSLGTVTLPPQGSGNLVDGTPPPAPTGLVGVPGSTGGQPTLTWGAVVGATDYVVLRSTSSGGPYSPVGTTTGTTFTDPAAAPGTGYYYVVQAWNGSGSSANSTQVSATTVPAAPTGLLATGGPLQVSLTWSASTGATGYAVLRSTTSGGSYALIGTTSGTSFTDTGLVSGTTYYYVVRAADSSGSSANSASIAASPTTPPPATNKVAVLNPDHFRILKFGALNGSCGSNSYYSLATLAIGDCWFGSIPTCVSPSMLGQQQDFIEGILSSGGYYVTEYDATTLPNMTPTDYGALVIGDPITVHAYQFARSVETALPDFPDMLGHFTQSVLTKVTNYVVAGGRLILVGDAVRLLENAGPGQLRLNFGKTVTYAEPPNFTSDTCVPQEWLFVRGNPFCCVSRSGSGSYSIAYTVFPISGTLSSQNFFNGCDIPEGLVYSDTIYEPTDASSLIDVFVSGSGQFVNTGAICNPPVYPVTVSSTITKYIGYTSYSGVPIYYIGSDSFFDYRYYDQQGAWHCSSYQTMTNAISGIGRQAIISLVQRAMNSYATGVP